jgi:Domain of unknown function (DUF4878)
MANHSLRAVFSFVILLSFVGARAGGADAASPEDVLKGYLSAIQNQQFDKAYDLVSKAMKTDRKTGQVKPKEVWVKESQYIFGFSEAKIFDFKVQPAKIEGGKATVPNLLSSQDKFLNQLGVEEYELYTLVKEDGAWKVDQQQEVVEQSEIAKWFPKKK